MTQPFLPKYNCIYKGIKGLGKGIKGLGEYVKGRAG
jgi:hypothetical protein